MYADAHCDTITTILDKEQQLKTNNGQLDLERLFKHRCVLQFFALWADPKHQPYMALPRCIEAVDYFYRELANNKTAMHMIKYAQDVDLATEEGKLGALLSIEGGSALGGRLAALRMFYRLGVRAMTLTWNGRNELADGVGEGASAGGLSSFGKEVVDEMDRLGMLVDVSHLSEKGFWDVAQRCEGPFIASHSNAKAICPHPRNLTDAQIICLIQKGGFVGLNFYADFVSDGPATVDDIVRHADHILALGGESVLGFGGDFDGVDRLPSGIRGAQDMDAIMQRLSKLGCSDKVLHNIFCGNLQRVVKAVLKPCPAK